jgi:D-alanyl-D-alanine carboxypeptidase
LSRFRSFVLKKSVFFLILPIAFFCFSNNSYSKSSRSHAKSPRPPALSARSAVIVNADNGKILYSKNAHLKLPPASTTKVMTVLVAMGRLRWDEPVLISQNAANAPASRGGFTRGARYKARDLMVAAVVASSNDAAVALAEAVAGSEAQFAELMNDEAKKIGMKDTFFVNATGLTDKHKKQHTTAYDLSLLMRRATKNAVIDQMMGVTYAKIRGSDGKTISIKSHNKMLWRMPRCVKGKTGWTFASRHTFVGTDYAPDKKIAFAMLSSKEPWSDIKHLALFGLLLRQAH